MNKPARSVCTPMVATPMTRTASGEVSVAQAVPGEPEATDERALFLVWSSGRTTGEIEAGRAEGWVEGWIAPAADPARAGRRDRGWWLFRDAVRRRESWLLLHAEPATVRERAPASGYAAMKRASDVVGALVLLALLAPVLALVALLIRLDSPGPAIFRQWRVGKDGAEFLMWKFRSMHTDAPEYAPSPTSTTDARLTRAGRLIRRVSLDELPQLINVLRGEMSLVGPRPEMPFIVARYTALERRRLAVKPGITGLWQISPARAFPIHENLEYDLHYIRHQNLVLDGAILLRTMAAVVRGVGAR